MPTTKLFSALPHLHAFIFTLVASFLVHVTFLGSIPIPFCILRLSCCSPVLVLVFATRCPYSYGSVVPFDCGHCHCHTDLHFVAPPISSRLSHCYPIVPIPCYEGTDHLEDTSSKGRVCANLYCC